MDQLYVLGSQVKEKSFPLEVAEFLDKNCTVLTASHPEAVLEAKGSQIVILDVMKGAKKPMVVMQHS